MSRKFLGTGWKFPIQIDHRGGIALSRFEEDIRESIFIILGTAKGERLMRPDFGCGIHELVFAPMNTATEGLVLHHVKEALIRWEPRIEVLRVDVSREKDNYEGYLFVDIEYRVISTNNVFNLVYPFYLQGQGGE